MRISDQSVSSPVSPFQEQVDRNQQPHGPVFEERSLKAIWASQNLEPVSKLILLSLARRCPSREILPDKISITVKTICEETNSSHQTVSTHLKTLQEQGYILIESLSHKKREYRFTEKIFSDYEKELILKGSHPSQAKVKSFESSASPDSLWLLKGVSSSQKLLLLWFASQCKDSKYLVPHLHRQEEMSLFLGLSKNSLTRVIQGLERKELLYVIRTVRHPNVYVLEESLFLSSFKKDSPVSPKKSQIETSVPKEIQNGSGFEKNESRFGDIEIPLSSHSIREEQRSLSNPQQELRLSSSPSLKVKEQENPSYSLYPHMEYLPVPDDWKKPENEAFAIAKLLLTTGKEDAPLCYLTIYELSKYLLEAFGLSLLRNIKKLSFKHQCFGMTLHRFQWICKELHERRNPFEEPRGVEEQKALLLQRKQAEQNIKDVEERIQRKYLESQYEEKKQKSSLEREECSESPLETFRKTWIGICLKYFYGPEDQLLEYLGRVPLVNLRLFRNEYEKLPLERFESLMKTWIENQFSSYSKKNGAVKWSA